MLTSERDVILVDNSAYSNDFVQQFERQNDEASELGNRFLLNVLRRAPECHSKYRALVNKILNLRRLGRGWDSYGANEISSHAVLRALGLLLNPCYSTISSLGFPDALPTTSGNIQFEWHLKNVDVELVAESEKCCSIVFENLKTGEILEWSDSPNIVINKLAMQLRKTEF